MCVLKTDGVNCDEEMSRAFEVAGAYPVTVHINELRWGERKLTDFAILALPGGFSYGDDIASGRVLATELTSHAVLSEQIRDFTNSENPRPIIGICNGFQVLVKTGLLPDRTIGTQSATLAENAIGTFDCRWINLAAGESACRFVKPEDFADQPIPMQTAHGEGRFFARDDDVRRIAANNQVVFRYTTPDFGEPEAWPDNPNGSLDNIAGICDSEGVVLGMMPHPERSVEAFHPYRRLTEPARRAAELLFKNIVTYAKEM